MARTIPSGRPRLGTLLHKVENSTNHWQCRNDVANAILENYPEIKQASKNRTSTKGKAELKQAIEWVLDGIRDELTNFE